MKDYVIEYGTSDTSDGNLALHTNDNTQQVLENRLQFSKKINVDPSTWTLVEQTHSLNIVKIDHSNKYSGALDQSPLKNFDALYTREANVPIGVFSADCIPILIYDESQDLICAIHSGWKASVQSFLKIVIDFLVTKENCNTHSMHVYFGPSISFDHFEIKEDVISLIQQMPMDTFEYIKEVDGKFYGDMLGLNILLATTCGIEEQHIEISKYDTFTSGFSYRKDKTINRHLSYIIKKVRI